MRKMKCIFLVLCICISSLSVCFAAENTGQDQEAVPIKPAYETVYKLETSFKIDSDGMAAMKSSVKPINSVDIDKVNVTFKISKIDGTVVYNRTFQAPYNQTLKRFECLKTFDLNRRGNYRLNATVKCYKNGKLIETINCLPLSDTY